MKSHLTPAETEQGLKFVIRDGLTTQAMLTLTSGAFLTDFTLKLGASNLVIGLLAAIPALTQLVQIPTIYLVERFRNRRAITIGAVSISRSFLLLLAAIPFLAPGRSLALLLVALTVHWIFVAVGGCSWNSWMRDLVPEERLGVFFARRLAWAAALGIALSLAAGAFIDYWKNAHAARVLPGYALLFATGWFAGMLGVYFISRIPEPALAADPENLSVPALLRRPLADRNFRNLIAFLGPWNFVVNLVLPFFTVYMLKYLGLSLSRVIAFTVLQQTVYFFCLKIWGRYIDRFSNKTVLSINGLLFLVGVFAWVFTARPGRILFNYALLAVIHILLGISVSGTTLAAGNIGLKMAPRGRATTYLASLSVVNSLASGLAPILGGKFVDFFAQHDFSQSWCWTAPGAHALLRTLHLQPWHFLFVFACIPGLYCLQRLSLVKEPGEVRQDLLVRELMAEMRKKGHQVFNAMAGLRQLFQMPLSFKTKPRSSKEKKAK